MDGWIESHPPFPTNPDLPVLSILTQKRSWERIRFDILSHFQIGEQKLHYLLMEGGHHEKDVTFTRPFNCNVMLQ